MAEEHRKGRICISIPENARPTAIPPHDDVWDYWILSFHGELPKRPAIQDEYTITVLPKNE